MSLIDFSNFASKGKIAIGTTPEPLIPFILQERISCNNPFNSSLVFKRVIATVDGLIICATLINKY